MIRMEKFLVDASSRKVTCKVCQKKCWQVIQSDHSAFKCVNPDCTNKTILFLVPDFFQKVAENLNKSAAPEEKDFSEPIRARLSKSFFWAFPKVFSS